MIDFLSGDTRTIVRSLEARMREAAAEERFEDATRYRNRLHAIESLAQRQGADRRAVGTIDVIGLAVDGDRAAVQLFPLRDGRLIDRYAFHLENVEGQDRQTILEGFCLEYYTAAPSVPPQLIVPSDLTDTEGLAGFLSELRGAAVEVRAPARGEKKRLAELAAENAELALTHETTAAEQKRLRRIEALESLRESLNLESLPVRVECFDISNLQGRDIVASMTVFVDAQPKKAHYRSFTVRGLDGQDDFASMGQVIARRFARLRDAGDAGRYDESFASVPNLVVIDGGKGQLAAALEAMQATAGLPRVAVIALAKREEEVFVPGRSQPILLDRHDPGLQLLQRIRDEAHRFAITHPPAEARHACLRVDLRHDRRHRPGAAAGDPAALRLGRPLPRRVAGAARGGAGAAGEDGAVGVRAAPSHRRACDVLSRPLRGGLARLGRGLAEADRAEREQDRGEPEDDVDGGERQPHADAEGEQRRPRRLTAERVDEECLLRPDAAGADGNERGEALRGLDEQHVAERLVDAEGSEHEPDRREAEAPSRRAARTTTVRSQRAGRADDGECLADVVRGTPRRASGSRSRAR